MEKKKESSLIHSLITVRIALKFCCDRNYVVSDRDKRGVILRQFWLTCISHTDIALISN